MSWDEKWLIGGEITRREREIADLVQQNQDNRRNFEAHVQRQVGRIDKLREEVGLLLDVQRRIPEGD